MGLYTHLASVYDEIFPANPATIAFIDGLAGKEGSKGLAIDLGSATGSHVLALSKLGWEAFGVELSNELLAISRKKQELEASSAKFLQADMLDIGRHFDRASTDLILCLGNTLPHLASLLEVQNFLIGARGLLRQGGRILLQLVNFSLASPGFAFPTIEGRGFRFERSYAGLEDGRIAFDTLLTFNTGQSYADRTSLLPLTLDMLGPILRTAGFAVQAPLAGWDGSAFDPSASPYLVILGSAPTA